MALALRTATKGKAAATKGKAAAMARESALWKWLSEGARKRYGDNSLFLQRIENGLERGTPDVEGCLHGQSFWLELKSAVRPTRPTTNLPFPCKDRPEQFDWQADRWKARFTRAGWLLLVTGLAKPRAVYFVSGEHARRFEQGVTERELEELNGLTSSTLIASEIIWEIAYFGE